MSTKADSVVFAEADIMKQFILGQNHRVVSWITANWERCDKLTGPITKSTVSNALLSKPIVAPVANAMDILLDEMQADPWAWCKPPDNIDNLSEYSPLAWWYKVLKPAVSWTRFKRINKFPLEGADRELTIEALDKWSAKLKAACDQFKIDCALVKALEIDEDPEYQHWLKKDGELSLVNPFYAPGKKEAFRRRVGNAGLHGRSEKEVGLAWALADKTITLPDIEGAKLLYSRPRVVRNTPHTSEPVEPWNGDEFDGDEYDNEVKVTFDFRPEVNFDVKHRVCYYWHIDRYEVEDVEPFAMIKIKGVDMEYCAPTQNERDLLETGMHRTLESKEEASVGKDTWIDNLWEERKKSWEFGGNGIFTKEAYPDGIPRSAIEDHFDNVIERIDMEKVTDEIREISNRRFKFRRQWRRRKYVETIHP